MCDTFGSMNDGGRAGIFSGWYMAGSLAAAVAVFAFVPGTPGSVMGVAILLQGVLLPWISRFWKSYEGFAESQDWAGGSDASPKRRQERAMKAGGA